MPANIWSVNQRVFLRIIALLLGLIAGVLHGWATVGSVLSKIADGSVLMLLIFLVEQMLELHHRFDEDGDVMTEIKNMRKDLDERLADTHTQLLQKAKKFQNAHPGILANLLQTLSQDYLAIDSKSFVVDSHDLAIYSYDYFWTKIVERQRERNSKGEASLEVHAVHSCDIGIFVNHQFTARVLDNHRQFKEAGGIVRRILCYTTKEVPQTYQKARDNMVAVGVDEVRYHYSEFPLNSYHYNFAWDFLLLDKKDAVIWVAPTPTAAIVKAEYSCIPSYVVNRTSGDKADLNAIWQELYHTSYPLTASTGPKQVASE